MDLRCDLVLASPLDLACGGEIALAVQARTC